MRTVENDGDVERGPHAWPLWKKIFLAAGFWTIVGLFFSTQSYLLHLHLERTWLEAVQNALPRWYIWGLLAPLVIKVDLLLPRTWSLRRRLLTHLPLGLAWTSLVVTLVIFSRLLFDGALPTSLPRLIGLLFYADILVYGLIIGISMAWRMGSELRERDIRAARLERSLTEARLHSLRSQLNPHFLFNALNTISACTEKQPRVARRMMAHLGELLRFSLDHANRQEITLEEELHFLEKYLEIERTRFDGRVAIATDVDPSVRGALIPSFLLQPLVENAIRHGITKRIEGGHIRVSATRQDGVLVVCVQDDGVGLPKNWKMNNSNGVGLRNLDARLQELYGDRYTLRVQGVPGDGVCIEIELPYRDEPAELFTTRVEEESNVTADSTYA